MKVLFRLFALAGILGAAASGAAAETPSGHAMNNVAVKFLTLLDEGKPKEAFDLTGPRYIQHNPNFPDGKEAALNMFMHMPPGIKLKHDIKRVLVDGDLIAVHSLMTTGPNDRGTAMVDIMRIENGKIVEHWDVIQPVPEKSTNTNSMF